uniref:Uncharacterized protein C32A11.02c n=1 Tax=Anthurium amnicola TaxID=1678845 RepID=A0A1D1YYT7_9ARAE
MTYHYSRPRSVYTQSNLQVQQPSSVQQRPFSVVGYEGYEGLSSLQQQPSFRVIRRRHQRKNVRSNNVLNPTLDNFYNTLRRAEADLNVKSAKSWLKEYEGYRRQVINAEKSNIVNTRPVSCYTPSLVSSPSTMEYQRYSMQF